MLPVVFMLAQQHLHCLQASSDMSPPDIAAASKSLAGKAVSGLFYECLWCVA
jgi:hypothetical protein